MDTGLSNDLRQRTAELRQQGLFKEERTIASPQGAHIELADGRRVINFCANNYLGLANDQRLELAAAAGMAEHGYGTASVRFICGTQSVHKELEARLAGFLDMDDAILYSSCFDANGGLFETLLDTEDAVISDALNHASIIDGIRLSKARRLRYANNDMKELEQRLLESADSRYRLIATDGVFSMDGVIADLPAIAGLAEKHQALVMVDDSHAVGFIGAGGGGTPEFTNTKVDILTGTLGKALGGASGGYTAASAEIVGWLRQRSRPYLFSNSLAPGLAASSLAALSIVEESAGLRAKLAENSEHFRKEMTHAGFQLAGANHPIIPVMLGDARLATEMANRMLAEGIYVIGFSFPVVPQGEARIRTQMSAAHSSEDIDLAVSAFVKVGRELGVPT
ncbi:MAG TPA: glycine C-acetyltransferase [Acidimicrobiia bacterium]|nr:glycine C-acetyltransferase [Acidimicrobiia bacterium]